MKRQEIDHILARMLDSYSNVSDLNFTVGKPLQVESSGELLPVDLKPSIKTLTPFQTETKAERPCRTNRGVTTSRLTSSDHQEIRV